MSDYFDPDDDAVGLKVCVMCGGELNVQPETQLGEVIWCNHCGAELEVISLDPLRVDVFEEEEK